MSKDSTTWHSKTVEFPPLTPSLSLSTSRSLVTDAETAPIPSYKSIESTDENITLHAGPGTTGRTFCVRKDLFHSVTTFSSDKTGSRVVFPPDTLKDDPRVFDMFVNWLNEQEDLRPYTPLEYSPEPWRSHAAAAWVFGGEIDAAKFQRYALSQFIANCATVDLSTWRYIEMRAKQTSSLRRFSNHWVAWNHHLAPASQSEYKDLSAARLASSVSDDTVDPRILDINHWYSICGDNFSETCIHDPLVAENLVQQVLSIAKKKQPPDEWGRDWETKHKTPQKEKADLPSSSSNTTASATPNGKKTPPKIPPRPSPNRLLTLSKAQPSGANTTKSKPPPLPLRRLWNMSSS